MSVIIHGLNMPRRSAVQVIIYPDGQAVVKTASQKTFVCDATNKPKASKQMFGCWLRWTVLKRRRPNDSV